MPSQSHSPPDRRETHWPRWGRASTSASRRRTWTIGKCSFGGTPTTTSSCWTPSGSGTRTTSSGATTVWAPISTPPTVPSETPTGRCAFRPLLRRVLWASCRHPLSFFCSCSSFTSPSSSGGLTPPGKKRKRLDDGDRWRERAGLVKAK